MSTNRSKINDYRFHVRWWVAGAMEIPIFSVPEIELKNRKLLAEYVLKISRGAVEHDAGKYILRNGRWGCCAMCPRDHAGKHPEACNFTGQYDHNIHSTKGGKFYHYGREIPESELITPK